MYITNGHVTQGMTVIPSLTSYVATILLWSGGHNAVADVDQRPIVLFSMIILFPFLASFFLKVI